MNDAAKALRATGATLALIPWGLLIALQWIAMAAIFALAFIGVVLALPGMGLAAMGVALAHLLEGDWRGALKVRARLLIPDPEGSPR